MRSVLTVGIVLLCALQPAADENPVAKNKLSFNLLWNSNYSLGSNGNYKQLGIAIRALGGKITELGEDELYTDELLEDFDIVALCIRVPHLLDSEQKALVSFVRDGGSLLVMTAYSPYTYMNPILTNFGIVINETRTSRSKANVFAHPATTERRPVSQCYVDRPHLITVRGKAKAIGGRDEAAQPAAISQCFFALGGNSGKGRVVATGDISTWLSDKYKFMPISRNWGKGDNTELFENTFEYLAGASDLRVKTVKSGRLVAGSKHVFKAQVQNLEQNFSREVELSFYLSQDKEFQADKDTLLITGEVPEIRGKKAKWVKIKSETPKGLDSGKLFLLAVINPGSDPLEVNPDNNVGVKKISVK